MKIIYDAKELKKIISQVKKCTTDTTREALSRIYFQVMQDGTTRVTVCNGYMLECLLIYGKLSSSERLDFSIPAVFSIPIGAKQVIVERADESADISFSYPNLGYSNVFKSDEKGREFMDDLEAKLNPKTEEEFSVCLGVNLMLDAIKAASSGSCDCSRPSVRLRFYKDDHAVTFEPMHRGKEGQKVFLLKVRD